MNALEMRHKAENQNDIIDKFFEHFSNGLHLTDQFLTHFDKEKCFNQREKEYLHNDNMPNSERISKFLDIVKRKHLMPQFHKALLASRQIQLANMLKSEDTTLPDPPAIFPHHVTSIIVHQLTEKAIEENQEFYEAEIASFPGTPETCGVIDNLSVDCVDLPIGSFKFDPKDTYKNFSRPKGFALIINNRDFLINGGLPNRLGTDVDCANMLNLLTALGYSCKVKENLESQEMLRAMKKFANCDHRHCDSVIVVILSHGKHGRIYGTDCLEVAIEKLVIELDTSHCPMLAGKPKIFFIQACRGEKYDLGLDFADGKSKEALASGDATTVGMLAQRVAEIDLADANVFKNVIETKTPACADSLIAYATTPGYVSWRNSLHGSWFIQSICEVFCKNAKSEELHHMLLEVNRLVSERVSTSCHVQIPEPCTRLRKKFFFFPGIYLDNNNY